MGGMRRVAFGVVAGGVVYAAWLAWAVYQTGRPVGGSIHPRSYSPRRRPVLESDRPEIAGRAETAA